MDDELKQLLDEDYDYKVNYVLKLKNGLNLRIQLLKAVLILLLILLIYEPGYVAFYSGSAYLNGTYQGRYNSIVNFFPFIFIILAIIPLVSILKGFLPIKWFFFYLGLLLIIIQTSYYYLWIIQFIGLVILYKTPEILVKYSKTFADYQSYEDSYFELYTLKRTFDNTIKRYIINYARLLILSYSILIVFELFPLKIGLEASVVLPLVLLPVIILALFYSPLIFGSIKKFYAKKDKANS